MGCACRSGASKSGPASQYEVIGPDGTHYGPYLTSTDARMQATAIGGGVVKPIVAA